MRHTPLGRPPNLYLKLPITVLAAAVASLALVRWPKRRRSTISAAAAGNVTSVNFERLPKAKLTSVDSQSALQFFKRRAP